jgi:dipeptidyl-peptidase-4
MIFVCIQKSYFMKKYLFICAALISFSAIAQKQNLNLDSIWLKGKYREADISAFKPLNDGKNYVELNEKGDLVIYDFANGKAVTTMVKSEDLSIAAGISGIGGVDELIWSMDEKYFMIPTQTQAIYRHSTVNNFMIYDIVKKASFTLSTNGKQQEAAFSPDAKYVAFVRDNNLFIKNISVIGETQITDDGKKNSIINGIPDWVYEEEFAFSRAFEWSPDSKKIAWIRFDESQVPEYTLQNYNDHYPENYTYKYPKVGEKNSIVSVKIYDVETKKTTTVEIGNDTEQYIPRIKWTQNPNQLCITRLNRLQNKLELLIADAMTGKTNVLFTEESKYYIDINDDLYFLKDNSFIWTSSKDGYNHIYLYNSDGSLKKQISSGKYDITKFYGCNEKNMKVYFQSAEISSIQRYIYSIEINTGVKMQLTTPKGVHYAEFNPGFTYFLDKYSDANTPKTVSIYSSKGKSLRILEDNAALKKLLSETIISPLEFFTITTPENVTLNASIMKPANFDATKKYPVLMRVYGGPGSQEVFDEFSVSDMINFGYICQQGYIILCVDNRGTGGKGEEFQKCTYLQLGKLETQDQIAAARYIGSMPYVDASRIGIFGWSFGGYMSTMCISLGADVFKTAVAVAPVTDWRFYDSIYTERYMRTNKENKNGYDETSPVLFADKIKGNYLIIHGLSDDNVHYQNTAQILKALYKNNVKFTQMTFPDKNHGIYGGNTRFYLFTQIFDYVQKNL